jgi:hypothetical protein
VSDDPLWRRTLTGWLPADEQAQELFSSFAVGDVCRFKPRKMRNPAFLRKFFALVSLCVDSTEGWTVDSLRKYVAIETGHFTPYTFPARPGIVLREAKSISFGKMDSDTFTAFFNDAINVMIRDVVPHISEQELRDAVEMTLATA